MYIKADESDYIRIGNRIIPKNAAEFGDASYDKVSQIGRKNYEAEMKAKAEAEAQAEAEATGKIIHADAFANVDPASSVEDQLQSLFDALVPDEGQCDNLGGELVRAMMRIMYRDYNDGDVFYEGYGLETCCSDAAFIIDMVGKDSSIAQSFFNIAYDGLQDSAYTNALQNIASELIEYLKQNYIIFGTPTEDSRTYGSRTCDEIEEAAPKYDYDVDTSGDLTEYIDNDCISWRDVEDFLENLASYYGGSVHHWALDGFTITDLDREQYEEWDRMYENELRGWLSELESEFPNFGIEEEEYDEEDEEDEF